MIGRSNAGGGGAKVTIDGVKVTEDLALTSRGTSNIKLTDLPYEFDHGAALLYRGEIHILGGGTSSTGTNHYKWNGTAWVSVSTLPFVSYYGYPAVVYNDEIHLMSFDSHYKWNGTTWTKVCTLPYNFVNASAVVYNNEIHVLGGSSNAYTKHYKWNGTTWTSVSTLPYMHYDSANNNAEVYENNLHLVGSSCNGSTKKHYKWNGTTWTSVSTLPHDTQGAIVNDNSLYAFADDSTIWHKWNGTAWKQQSSLPYTFDDGCILSKDKTIHILGSYRLANHYALQVKTYMEAV